MFVVGDRVVCDATDLVRGARCEFALLRALDTELGTVAGEPAGGEPGTGSADIDSGRGEFGRVRAATLRHHGDAVVRPAHYGDTGPFSIVPVAHDESIAACRDGAPAVLGATVFDGEVFARAELLTRTPQGVALHGVAPGHGQPVATALRLTAAAHILEAHSVPVDPVLTVYSDDETHTFDLQVTRPVYRARRRRTDRILDEHSGELLPVQWGDPRFRACGRCPVCVAAYTEARDLLLVAGMDPAVRAGLRAAGITSIDRLTTRTAAPPEVSARTLSRLRAQAVVQLRREQTGRGEWVAADTRALDLLPPATPGDLALDIRRPGPGRVRIEVTARDSAPVVREIPLRTAADRLTSARERGPGAAGRRAFTDLLAALTEPLLADPGLHIFHYTAEARTVLLQAAGQLGFGEETVDALLRTGTLVDLYPIVRGAFVIGTRSYALHEITPVLGSPPQEPGAAAVLWLADRLRKERSESSASVPAARPDSLGRVLRDTPTARPTSTEAALAEFAARSGGAAPDTAGAPDPHRVAGLTAALLGYHRREQQAPWWSHIDRLIHPLPDWPAEPGVMVADTAAVDTKWHIGPDEGVRRFLRLTGRLAGGGLAPGTPVHVVYEPGGRTRAAIRTVGTATVLGCSVEADFTDTVRLEETLAPGAATHDELPVALAPALPAPAPAAADVVEEIGRELLMTLPAVPETALFDLLARRAPRLRFRTDDSARPALPPAGEHPVPAIHTALRDLDCSCLAVQAPTGTGRTAILAEVLAALVTRDNWRIGVVAPTAAPVESLLDAVVRAGVLPELVAKSEAVSVAPEWLVLDAARHPRFLSNAIRGCVLGGTLDDFTDPARVPRDSLDLLVIADANSCALAVVADVSGTARNLLLTGDPCDRRRPAPGPHPEPVDVAALTWFAGGRETLPPTHGYFLGRTSRLHPRLAEPLSRLWFENRLRADPVPTRPGDTLDPGIGLVPVHHHGNSTASDAEAKEVLNQIRELLGRRWDDGTGPRPLQAHDIVVVSPHRAQVGRIRTLLSRARFDEVLVGTPDLLRGREAAVVLLSPATSSPEDSPVPVGELLSGALLHDTLGRARRRAIIVGSPLLTEFLPESPRELSALSRFLRLYESS
ncbi:AAA domain-containing protein [Nocardia sp. NPDC024068]|uniref:AAA domain-containing protein n=1 Tax=Nocardia sp. NPDC024068 TaxID=3157197 RepID=UPI0033F96E59